MDDLATQCQPPYAYGGQYEQELNCKTLPLLNKTSALLKQLQAQPLLDLHLSLLETPLSTVRRRSDGRFADYLQE